MENPNRRYIPTLSEIEATEGSMSDQQRSQCEAREYDILKDTNFGQMILASTNRVSPKQIRDIQITGSAGAEEKNAEVPNSSMMPTGELIGRARTLDSEQRREQQMALERYEAKYNLSRSRSAEFITLMQQHGVPTVDLHERRGEVIGKGWVIVQKGMDDDYDYDGLILLDDLRTVGASNNRVCVVVNTFMNGWSNTPEDTHSPYFGDDKGLDLLAQAMIRLGAVPNPDQK